MDGAIAERYVAAGMPDYRPRFSPVVRAVAAEGPLSIRDLARATGVTHSAASQTVAQLQRAGYVELRRGTDARTRIVELTGKARVAMPAIEADWQTAEAAVAELETELPASLTAVLLATLDALARRSFADRLSAASDRPRPAARP
jgi:DNA-binding MarR family transcriptional regulator